MWQEFDSYPITLKSDLGQLLKVTQTATQASLHYADEIISADLVLACDGARSNLRDLVNIGSTGWQYAQSCMGVLVKMDAPQQDITWQEFQPTGPVAFLPMQAPYANLIWYHHHDELLRLSQLDNNALKDAIIQTYPVLAGDFEIQSKAVFPLTRQHANHYSSGRVVLLGDAAHAINPLAGQGVNLGFKDVAELSESLQQEQSIELALKRYERKRRLPNLAMMSMMDACYFTFSNTNKPLSLLRNAVIKGLAKATPLQSHILKYAVGNYL
jgi:2-octaprenyl-3-methyl-6-methoxy-1,4-benzoquinol hydroxylase